MINARSLFIADDQRASDWRAMAHSALFETAVIYALAEFAAGRPSHEETAGALRLLAIVCEMGNTQEAAAPLRMPALVPPEQLVPTPAKTTPQ